MIIIGHRGAAGLAAENSVSSFKKAQELGVDMIEMDLRRNSKGQIIASHDRSRKDNVSETLSEILSAAHLPLNLEIKESGFESELLSAIKRFASEVLISSKYPRILKKVRALDGKIKLGLILGRANFFLLPFIPKLDRSLNLYSIHPRTFLCLREIILYLKGLNKKIFVWTVNNQNQFDRIKQLQIDGVFTDYPNLIKK